MSNPPPKLLSGGNPRIAEGDGEGPVLAWLDAAPGWKGEVSRELHALILATVPGVAVAVRWNTPFYGVPGNGWFMGYHCLTRCVKVSFLRGAGIDPMPPVASKQPGVRHAHLFENDPIDPAGWAEWIRQAAALPGEPLF